ncbi:MAG: IS1595 family transposase [Reyranella sp.]|uniref:IS1595 family transposase n=1 Tax=Reyranella sp. TaxID=1929291 RepID=UPI001ACB4675|nr:IS1595 family transposase [Reyranella sp.]MBN9086013.1 IS1595 family transposase [Reyranella sp.]
MSADLAAPQFTDENAAREALEAIRWPGGPVCPFCGVVGNITRLQGKSARPGQLQCNDCRRSFTVTVGTVFERSHIPLHKWLLASHLMASSKKGISAHQLHRMLGVTYKTAWFMAHRIREAMTPPSGGSPLGGSGKHIEADETYIGKKHGKVARRGTGHKRVVVSLVERGGGVRSFHVDTADIPTVKKIIDQHADRASTLNTDEAAMYSGVGREFAKHQMVHHGREEFVRGDAHTNTLEGYFSIFKRGMKGVYQHCDERHLQRYLNEFDFRYSNRAALGTSDKERATKALKGIEGKRLTYRRINREQAASLG